MSDIDQIEQSIMEMRGDVEFMREMNSLDEAPRLKQAYQRSVKEQAALLRDKRLLALAVANVSLSVLTIAVTAAPQFTTTKVPGWISDVCSKSSDAVISRTPDFFQRFVQRITPEFMKSLFANATPKWLAYVRGIGAPAVGDHGAHIVNGIDFNKVAQHFAGLFGYAERILRVGQEVISKYDDADQAELRAQEGLYKAAWDRALQKERASAQIQEELQKRRDNRADASQGVKNAIK